jgi:hypothetical protein
MVQRGLQATQATEEWLPGLLTVVAAVVAVSVLLQVRVALESLAMAWMVEPLEEVEVEV